ncbi:MAG: DUF1653 domain-containing protein [Candidatus Levyibacteriota bacterium]
MSVHVRSGIYQHYSGLLVFVLGVARHSETEEKLVAYIPLGVKKGPRITVRPYTMFFEEVNFKGAKKARFIYIGEEMPEELAKEYLPLSR